MSMHGHRSFHHRPVCFPGPISLRGPMAMRALLVLSIGSAGFAIASLWPAPKPQFRPLVSAAPAYDAFPADRWVDNDSAAVALRRQAGSALSQLVNRSAGERH